MTQSQTGSSQSLAISKNPRHTAERKRAAPFTPISSFLHMSDLLSGDIQQNGEWAACSLWGSDEPPTQTREHLDKSAWDKRFLNVSACIHLKYRHWIQRQAKRVTTEIRNSSDYDCHTSTTDKSSDYSNGDVKEQNDLHLWRELQ